MAVAGSVSLSLGGCLLSTVEKEHPSPIAEEVFSGRAHFDLTSPPSREKVGLPDGRSDITYSRPEPFFVRASLPERHELAFEARMVGFDSLNSPHPETGPPTTLDIHYYLETLEAGRDHLLAAVDQFGLEEQAVTEWYQEASNPDSAPGPSTIRSRWISTTVGYLLLQVRGNYRPAFDAAGSKQIVVHYSLFWGGEPAATSS